MTHAWTNAHTHTVSVKQREKSSPLCNNALVRMGFIYLFIAKRMTRAKAKNT